jgi:hypothetical protein
MRTRPAPIGGSRPVPVYRDRQQSDSQSSLGATHATPEVGDGLDRAGFCNKDRDSDRNQQEAAGGDRQLRRVTTDT